MEAMKPFSLVVNGYLYDYDAALDVLKDSHSAEERYETVKLLCELSRDICWGLGEHTDYVPDYIQAIVLEGEHSETLERFKHNIETRLLQLTSHVETSVAAAAAAGRHTRV